jgi:transposase
MSKYFRPWNIDQTLLLPPSVQDFVPKDHVSRFIVGLVRESLDLKEITGSYVSGLGQPPFDPRMMVALLLHGYASGLYSSRRIARACRERNDFVMIVALDPPDFRTISDFRKRHLKALGELFLQVLKLCETAGLVKLGHVALDGTKIKANASKHKAMSYERMKKREAELKAEVARMLAAAEAADTQEDETFGKDKRGDEMPDWAGDKEKRLAKIQEAMAALEADAKLAAEEERRIEAEKEKQRNAEGRKKPGKLAAPPSDEPDRKAQRNFTDPESRIMKSKDGFVQAYNAQAAVDAHAQIIVAHELTQCGSDQGQLVLLVEAIENNLGRKPEQASADSGYCSEPNLEALVARGIDGYVAPGRAKHPAAENGKVGGPLTQLMRKKIDDGGFETPYRLRKQVVEPVFGQIKQARGFRQFLLRGVKKVRAEWAMICTAHNLLKLFTLAKAA